MFLTDQDTALKAKLGGAHNSTAPDFLASFRDYDRNGDPLAGGAVDGIFTGATAVSLVAASGSDTKQRNVKSIQIHNADDTAITLTIQTDDGTNQRIVWKGTLATLETLSYSPEAGWQVHTTSGAAKGAAALAGGSLARGLILAGDSNGVAAASLDMGASAGKIIVDDGTDPAVVAVSGDATLAASGALTIAADAVEESMVVDSAGVGSELGIMKYGLALYDFAADGGGAPGAITLATSCAIPDNAVVQLDSYEVLTTFTSAGDSVTVKVGVATDGDLSTAIAIDGAGNPWDQGAFKGDTGAAAVGLAKKTTGARGIVLTTAVEALTAGKAVFCFRYWVSQ